MNSASDIRSVTFGVKFNHIKKTEFDKFQFRPKQLLTLDLSRFENISETALSRIIDAAAKTLTNFNVNYRCQGLSKLSLTRLSQCRKLKNVAFG